MEKRLQNRDDDLDGFDIKYVRCLNDLNTKRTSQMEAGCVCAGTVCLSRFLVFCLLRVFQVLAHSHLCFIMLVYYY